MLTDTYSPIAMLNAPATNPAPPAPRDAVPPVPGGGADPARGLRHRPDRRGLRDRLGGDRQRLEAGRALGLRGLHPDELPNAWRVLKAGWLTVVPLLILIAVLTIVTGLPLWHTCRRLLAVPVLALLPVAETVGTAGVVLALGPPRALRDTGAAGPQGPQGDPGPGPTEEQIAAAVAAYCSVNACSAPEIPSSSF